MRKARALLVDSDRIEVQQTLERGGLECVRSSREEALYHVYMSHVDLLVLVSPGNESLAILTAFEMMSDAPTVVLVPHLDSPSAEWAQEMEVEACLEIDDETGLLEQIEKLLA